jgi:hypothetical protein
MIKPITLWLVPRTTMIEIGEASMSDKVAAYLHSHLFQRIILKDEDISVIT